MSAELKRPTHGMIPGSHEWPRTPECRCGALWDRWNNHCAKYPEAQS